MAATARGMMPADRSGGAAAAAVGEVVAAAVLAHLPLLLLPLQLALPPVRLRKRHRHLLPL